MQTILRQKDIKFYNALVYILRLDQLHNTEYTFLDVQVSYYWLNILHC